MYESSGFVHRIDVRDIFIKFEILRIYPKYYIHINYIYIYIYCLYEIYSRIVIM
jgi:hypothetical protein